MYDNTVTFLKRPLFILDSCASIQQNVKYKINVKSSPLEANNIFLGSNILWISLNFNGQAMNRNMYFQPLAKNWMTNMFKVKQKQTLLSQQTVQWACTHSWYLSPAALWSIFFRQTYKKKKMSQWNKKSNFCNVQW